MIKIIFIICCTLTPANILIFMSIARPWSSFIAIIYSTNKSPTIKPPGIQLTGMKTLPVEGEAQQVRTSCAESPVEIHRLSWDIRGRAMSVLGRRAILSAIEKGSITITPCFAGQTEESFWSWANQFAFENHTMHVFSDTFSAAMKLFHL